MKEIEFKKEKLAANCKFSEQLISNSKIFMGRLPEDYIQQTLTGQIESFLLARINEKQFITCKAKRPTFLDWLLRKERYFDVEINCKEAMRNPPEIKDSILLYSANQL